MSIERAIYKASNQNAYTVSEQTSEMLDIIASFEMLSDRLGSAIAKRYGVAGDKIMDEYFEASSGAREYLFKMLNDSITEQMNTNGSNLI